MKLEGNELLWDEIVIKNQTTEKVKRFKYVFKKYSHQLRKLELEKMQLTLIN
jgi:hypothetical protein